MWLDFFQFMAHDKYLSHVTVCDLRVCFAWLLWNNRGYFFFPHYYSDSRHKIDIVTVTEANKYCANLVSFIDALTSVYVFVTLH